MKKVLVTILFAIFPCIVFAAAVSDYIWVTDVLHHAVMKIDKETGEIVKTVFVSDNPYGVAVDNEHVWVTCSAVADGSIFKYAVARINKTSGEVEDIYRPYGMTNQSSIGIAVDKDYVWVANMGANSVSRITKTNGSISEYNYLLDGPFGIAVNDTYVYVACVTGKSLNVIRKAEIAKPKVD